MWPNGYSWSRRYKSCGRKASLDSINLVILMVGKCSGTCWDLLGPALGSAGGECLVTSVKYYARQSWMKLILKRAPGYVARKRHS